MKNKIHIRWQLLLYDLLIFGAVVLLLLVCSGTRLSVRGTLLQILIALVCVFGSRIVGNVYGQVWRYGGIQCYIRLILTDAAAAVLAVVLQQILPVESIAFSRLMAIACMNLLGALTMRMFYRYAYKCGTSGTAFGRFLRFLLRMFAGSKVLEEQDTGVSKTGIAIIGAGMVGVSFAAELKNNPAAEYCPLCFVEVNEKKIGRDIQGIPVYPEGEDTLRKLRELGVDEVVFAIPGQSEEKKKKLYEQYKNAGFRTKVYDYPVMQSADGKRQLREFDIEELLFRRPITVDDESVGKYYRNKVILITGGGGSIGSELCRQLAKMGPKQIILLDIYENGAYDVRQELMIAYGKTLDVRIEIASITNRRAVERVFQTYHPQIVINAAAHKHVPLMEHNCVEAVENNVFGTKNVIELCEEYRAERFMMVSTDKAVNPTNVMGATKRMCEMMVQSASTWGSVKYSATRFGNVLGSAGSVIPLFKKQIASGGPVTITDKRIIRYFMTIPEASQLVLTSGAMAKNGELFVLDMGQPVKILDLAKNMIHLSGAKGIEIVETGLRPGEKLFEELLIQTEELDKTENDMIYIERDEPLSRDEINRKLELLKRACAAGDDEHVREALMEAVPTYRNAEEVNRNAAQSEEMKHQREMLPV